MLVLLVLFVLGNPGNCAQLTAGQQLIVEPITNSLLEDSEGYPRVEGISCADAFRSLQAGGVCGLCPICCKNKFGWYKRGLSREKIGGWMWRTGTIRCKWYYWAMVDELTKHGPRIPINDWCNWVAPPEEYYNISRLADTKADLTGPGPGRAIWGCKDSGNTYQNNMGTTPYPTAFPTMSPTPDVWSCVIEEKTDYKGSDLANEGGHNTDSCAKWCYSYEGCDFWSWASTKGARDQCWLKSSAGGRPANKQWNRKVTSGSKACGAPPTMPPAPTTAAPTSTAPVPTSAAPTSAAPTSTAPAPTSTAPAPTSTAPAPTSTATPPAKIIGTNITGTNSPTSSLIAYKHSNALHSVELYLYLPVAITIFQVILS